MPVPERLGRYRLLHPLSRGGMGEVYLARIEGPAGFAKTVVVKRMLGHLAGDARATEMFVREAQLAASLSHPNLVQVFELGEEAGEYFIAMEYVHGPSLRSVQKRLWRAGRTLEAELAASLVAQALRGLQHAHAFRDSRGNAVPIVHGDVSPENLLLGFDGLLKVTDFGVARALLGPPLSSPQPLRGKASYLAPEVRTRGDVQPLSDVFSAAVVLEELLGEAAPTAAMRAVVERGRADDVAKRFQSAAEMADALDAVGARETAAPRLRALLLELYGPGADAHPAGAAPWLGADAEDIGPPVMASVMQGTQRIVPEPSPSPAPAAVSGSRVLGGVVTMSALLAAAAVVGLFIARSSERVEAPDAGEPAQQASVPLPAAVVIAADGGGESEATTAEVLSEEPGDALAAQPPREHKQTGAGFVSVRANPWAEVRLGGKLLGVTPLARIRLPAGKHTLRLSHPPSATHRSVVVTVRSGRLAIVKADLTRD